MIVWLHLASKPPLQLTQDARALAYIDEALPVLEALGPLDALRDSVEGEVANITLSCSNRGGRCRDAFAVPPLGVLGTLYGVRNGEVVSLFVGALDAVELDAATCRLRLVA